MTSFNLSSHSPEASVHLESQDYENQTWEEYTRTDRSFAMKFHLYEISTIGKSVGTQSSSGGCRELGEGDGVPLGCDEKCSKIRWTITIEMDLWR